MLASRLQAAGIPAEIDGGMGFRSTFDVRVPASDLDEARTVFNSLSGRDRPLGLLDARRLIPALLVLAVILALLLLLGRIVS